MCSFYCFKHGYVFLVFLLMTPIVKGSYHGGVGSSRDGVKQCVGKFWKLVQRKNIICGMLVVY